MLAANHHPEISYINYSKMELVARIGNKFFLEGLHQ